MTNRVLVAILAMLVAVVLLGALQEPRAAHAAGSAPSMSWFPLTLDIRHSACLGMATKAISDAGLMDRQSNGWSRFGRNQAAAVLVTCVPVSATRTHIMVVTSSSDSGAAH